MKFKRIFLLILDSLGVGEATDAINFKDNGVNTLGHVIEKCDLYLPNLKKIGLLDTINFSENNNVDAYYTIAKPSNPGKDSINGHYELLGIKSNMEFKTYNQGFTYDILSAIEEITGRSVIGNSCCQDDTIIQELGDRQINYGSLIIYTSADSDLQVAAHEDCIPIPTLHSYCEKIREFTIKMDCKIARIIARPFTGKTGKYKFINNARKDFSTKPPKDTILEKLTDKAYNVISIGKISDLFDGIGITKTIKANNNNEVINKLTDIIDKNFSGLCIANLGDFDYYGHQRNVEEYANCIEELDVNIPIILNKLELDDLLIITADHGNDPTYTGNDHTRENVPVILYSRNFKTPHRLQSFPTFANIGASIAENFNIEKPEIGESFLEELE